MQDASLVIWIFKATFLPTPNGSVPLITLKQLFRSITQDLISIYEMKVLIEFSTSFLYKHKQGLSVGESHKFSLSDLNRFHHKNH